MVPCFPVHTTATFVSMKIINFLQLLFKTCCQAVLAVYRLGRADIILTKPIHRRFLCGCQDWAGKTGRVPRTCSQYEIDLEKIESNRAMKDLYIWQQLLFSWTGLSLKLRRFGYRRRIFAIFATHSTCTGRHCHERAIASYTHFLFGLKGYCQNYYFDG